MNARDTSNKMNILQIVKATGSLHEVVQTALDFDNMSAREKMIVAALISMNFVYIDDERFVRLAKIEDWNFPNNSWSTSPKLTS